MASCCGGGRCYCRLIEGDNVTITGTGEADNPYVVSATGGGGGGGGTDHFYYAEDYGTIVDGGDNLGVIQSMMDAMFAAGGGTWVVWRRYTWDGLLLIRGGCAVYQLALPQLELPAEAEIGLKALGSTAQVQWGLIGDSGSHDDNPGEIRNLFVDGDGVGGSGDALFVCDGANTAAYNLNVRRSVNHGIDLGSSQNLVFYNIQSGEHFNGKALLLKARKLTSNTIAFGRQAPGGNKIYGGHVGDSYLPIHVASNAPYTIPVLGVPTEVADFSTPHDNIIEGVLFETGRLAANPTIRANGVFESGDTTLRSCVATAGTAVTTQEEDACYVVDNPVFTGYSTTLTLDSCWIGGGAGAVKASNGVKVKQSGAFNTIRIYGRTQVANLQYLICADGVHLGAGSDLIGSVDGPITETTPLTGLFRGINGATFAGLITERYNPLRLIGQSGLADLLQLRRDTDTSFRLRIDRDGNIRFGPGTGATVSTILNGPVGLGINGENVLQTAAFTNATMPAASNPFYLHRLVWNSDLGMALWSDGTYWRDSAGWAYEYLAANFTEAANTDTNVFTGFYPAISTSYEVEFHGMCAATAQADALQCGFAGPSGSTRLAQKIITPGTGTSDLVIHSNTYGRANVATTVAQPAIIKAFLRLDQGGTVGSGNVRLQARAETVGQTVTIYAKSYMKWRVLA